MSKNAPCPLFFQSLALRAADVDVDARQSASHRVETNGEDNNIQIMLASGCFDPAACHPFDGRGAEIDETHVALIEDLIGVLFEGRSFDTVGMNRLRRREYLGEGRIIIASTRGLALMPAYAKNLLPWSAASAVRWRVRRQ
jgi:hypothetical protein